MSKTYNTSLVQKSNTIKTYTFHNEKYYKVVGRKGSFYIKVSDYEKISVKQVAITIYKYTLSGLKKIKSYIKTLQSEDILFIAGPKISTHFRMYGLEKA